VDSEKVENSESSKDKIVICLCTFERPEPLKEALDSLSRIVIPAVDSVEFVLVDNDKNGGAKHIFDAYEPEMRFKCHYFIEENRGLSNARNRAIEEALKLRATEIAMFDDDEIVDDDWLVELHLEYKRSCGEGVCGSTFRSMPLGSSKIVKKFWPNCKQPEHETVKLMQTNNCLFSADLVRPDKMNIRFNDRFNFSGREDLVFSLDAMIFGAKFFTAPNAIAIEKFQEKRATFWYLIRRWFENGVSDVAVAKHYKLGVKIRTAKETFIALLLFQLLPFLIFFGPCKQALALLRLTAAVGWLCGMCGKSAKYYLKHKD
jgi:glycosyltransferase involved in cell wall biosynthesis